MYHSRRDILDEVRNTMTTFKLDEENLSGLTADRAPAMIGNQNGFMSLMSKYIKQ